MVLISRRALVLLALVAILVTGFLGGYGYSLIAREGSGGGAIFYAQRFLYIALLCLVAEVVFFARAVVRSRNIQRELDRLIEITRYRGLSSAQNLKRLGPIGDQISQLYDQLNSLSERRSLKISSLSELVTFLMNNVNVPAVVVTVDGRVAYVSRVFAEREKRPRNELIEARLEDLAPGIEMAAVLVELDRSHSSVQGKSERGELTFYPIHNTANQLAYIVCVFQAHSALVEQMQQVVADQTSHGLFGIDLRRLRAFGGRRGRSRRTD